MGNRRKTKFGKKVGTYIVPILMLVCILSFSGCLGDENKNLKVVPNTQNTQSGKSGTENTSNTGKDAQNSQTVNKGSSGEANNQLSLEGTTYTDSNGREIIKDPSSILVLVNKKRNLPQDWAPADLVVPDIPFAGASQVKYMEKEAAEALGELFKQAGKDNISISGISGYRSYERQKNIFESNVRQYGEKQANLTVAYPGQSEHQTGLAMDISGKSSGYQLVESFGETVEGQWLKKNAADFGFIIRYQKSQESITGYSYEPWHVRYVGKEAAKYIMDNNITLEEYFGFKPV